MITRQQITIVKSLVYDHKVR